MSRLFKETSSLYELELKKNLKKTWQIGKFVLKSDGVQILVA